MTPLRIVFFGSFQDYSVGVLEALAKSFSVTAVITTPPRPAGRHMNLTPTKVQLYAKKHGIPVFPLENLDTIPKEIARGAQTILRRPPKGPERLQRPDFLIVAGYGKLIPNNWLTFPSIMSINMHPSLLPQYRGAFPAEWAILRGEKQTGVSLVSMTAEFDKGGILAQKKLPITPADTRETLYAKLYDEGAKLLVETLPKIQKGTIRPKPQEEGDYFYARRLTREDGFVPWEEFEEGLKTKSESLERKFRALTPWPGVWTRLPSLRPPATTSSSDVGRGSGVGGQATTRLKLIALSPEPIVQLEGSKPIPYSLLTRV